MIEVTERTTGKRAWMIEQSTGADADPGARSTPQVLAWRDPLIQTSSNPGGAASGNQFAATVAAVALSADEARRLALALPEAVERDHHGRPRRVEKILYAVGRDAHERDAGRGLISPVPIHRPICLRRSGGGSVWPPSGLTLRSPITICSQMLLTDAWEQKASNT